MSVVTLNSPKLFTRLVVKTSVSKRMKRFILNAVKTALVLSVVGAVFDQIGPTVAGDYFNLMWWGLVVLSLAVAVFIGWRFKVGVESGHLLFDDMDD